MAESYESSSTVAGGNSEEQLNELVLHDKAASARFNYLARVTCVHSPALFWARVGDAKALRDFDGYLATLNEWCGLQRGEVTEVPKLKSFIAVKLDNGYWERAQVMGIINEGKLTVFCVDTGRTAVINLDQVCPKEMPQLMQERSQAVHCCLADATHVGTGEWSEEAVSRFKSLVLDTSDLVHFAFHKVKLIEGQMCGDVHLYISDPDVPTEVKSVGKILAEEGLVEYTGDSNKGPPDNMTITDNNVTNCGTNCVPVEDKTVTAVADAVHEITSSEPLVTQDNNSCSSEDVVILEDPSSDEEEEEEEEDKETRSPNAVVTTVAETMDERAAANSEQVVGPSCLVENKNSFNIITRTSAYNASSSSSSSSSSDSDEDTWDESLLAPPKPKPAAGLYIKADIEKDMQKRKVLHDKFNQFISTPLPSAALSHNHGGTRGKKGGRHGSQRAGHRANSGRGFNPSSASSGRGGAVQLGRGILPFSQQQSPQQQFLQQPPQQPFPRQPSPQQSFSQQSFPQQHFPSQQPPRQQYPQQRSPQKQFTQQTMLYQPPSPPPDQFVQCSPPQSSPLQRLPQQHHPQPQYHSQPWQPPKLKSIFTNECPSKSTTSQAAVVIDLSQLDEKGMKHEYNWQRWTIERAMKKALDGLTEESVSTFTSQLQKILSDSSAIKLNQFPSSKGATWVLIRTVISTAVDKPVDCDKAVMALKAIYQTCTNEMTSLFSHVLQDCSEQVLKELTASNTQCQSYCNMVTAVYNDVHSAGANRGLQLVVDSAIDQLLSYWMKYALDINSSEMECGGCTKCITVLFDEIAPHLATNNRAILDKCKDVVKSLIMSEIPVKAREPLLDFYVMLVTKWLVPLSSDSAPTHPFSSVSIDEPVKANKSDQATVTVSRPLVKEQSPFDKDQASIEEIKASLKTDNTSSNQQDQTVIQSSQGSNQALINTTSNQPPHSLQPPNELLSTRSCDPTVTSTASSTNIVGTSVDRYTPPTLNNDPYENVSAMLNVLGLSHLLENFKAAIIQDHVLSCYPAELKEAMKEAGVPSGAILSIQHYISKMDNASSAMASHQYYQLPTTVMHQQPSYTAQYNTSQQPYPLHADYLQQQQPPPPHRLAAHFNNRPLPPTASQSVNYVTSPVAIHSPTHLLQQGQLHLQQGQPHNTLMNRVTAGPGP